MIDPLLGTEVGRYRVERLLGAGGMGAVYLAVQPMIGARVAIKVLSAECARNPELLDRFFAEARSVNLIRHENIVSVLDLAQLPDGRPYIVMEFIEGKTLGQLVRGLIADGQRVPIGGVLQVAIEMLSALEAAHAIGIIHRDLKPDNVLVTAEGHAKVLDFGIAKLAPGLDHNSPRTRTGALLGTPAYMAPEQITGAGNVSARSDVYAAGVVLYEAVTGTQPFAGETLFDLMRAHLEEAPQAPRVRRPDLPSGVEQVILTALAKDPARRFHSAAAMAMALRVAASELAVDAWRPLSGRSLGGRMGLEHIRVPTPTGHGATAVADRTEVRQPRRRALYIAIAAITAVGCVIGAIVLGSEQPSAPTVSDEPSLVSDEPHNEPPLASDEPRRAAGPTPASKPHTVVIESPARAARKRSPFVGHAKKFDAIGYLPKALAAARAIWPDARFTRMDIPDVAPNGITDLTRGDDTQVEYYFRSPARSTAASGPKNRTAEVQCYIEVDVSATEISVWPRALSLDPTCSWPLRPLPSCSLAQVWTKALTAGAAKDTVAKIAFLADGEWFFDSDGDDYDGLTESFADHCP